MWREAVSELFKTMKCLPHWGDSDILSDLKSGAARQREHGGRGTKRAGHWKDPKNQDRAVSQCHTDQLLPSADGHVMEQQN